jgi:hypothetical protein
VQRRHAAHEAHEALGSGLVGGRGGVGGRVALAHVLVDVVDVDSSHFLVGFVAEGVARVVCGGGGPGLEGADVAEVAGGDDAGVGGGTHDAVLEPEVDRASVVDGRVCPRVAHHEAFQINVHALLLLVAQDDAGGGVGYVVAAVALASDPEVVGGKLRELLVEALHEQVRVVGGALVTDGIVGRVLAVAEANTGGAFEVKPATAVRGGGGGEGRGGGGGGQSTYWPSLSRSRRWAAGCRGRRVGTARAAPTDR